MYVGVEVQVILIFTNKVAAICMSFLFLEFLEFIWYFNSLQDYFSKFKHTFSQ